MKQPYTTVHDLQDILMIYGDALDYKMTFWNFTDQEYLHLVFKGITKDPVPAVEFFAIEDDIYSNTLSTLKAILDRAKNELGENFDSARIQVINVSNRQPMHICFVGSSNVSRTIHWCIDYDDKNFRKFKRWFYWKRLYVVCKFESVIKRIKKLFNN